MLHILVCIVGTRMCVQKDISSLVSVYDFFWNCVTYLYLKKVVYPTSESWFRFLLNPGFPTAVISTMSFKVFVDVFLLA